MKHQQMRKDLNILNKAFALLPDGACPDNEATALIRLKKGCDGHSDWRALRMFFDRYQLEVIGSRRCPLDRQIEYFVCGNRDSFSEFELRLPALNSNTKGVGGINRIERILDFPASQKSASITDDGDLAISVSLHAKEGDGFSEQFFRYLRSNGILRIKKPRASGGITYFSLMIDSYRLLDIARFTRVRSVRKEAVITLRGSAA